MRILLWVWVFVGQWREIAMKEDFKLLQELNRGRRRSNTESSTLILKENEICFTSKNNGVHLIVEDFDFYPSTGLFINRTTKERGRGIFNLLKLLSI
jgi:hypothetical protein